MKEKIFPIIFFWLIFSLSSSAIFAQTEFQQTTILGPQPTKATFEIKVRTTVGGYLYDIKGLTSPWAQVELKSTQGNLAVTTFADDQGIFQFFNLLVGLRPGNFCFFSLDIKQNYSPPLCLTPPLPKQTNNLTNILLPPSLVLEKGIFQQKDQIIVNGRTFPNAKLAVFLFEENRPKIYQFLDLIKPTWAKEVPKLTLSSDKEGYFEFNLPTAKSGKGRIFVGAYWQENPSPPSNFLEFTVLPWWQWQLWQFWLFLKNLLILISKIVRCWWFLIALEFCLIFFLLKKLRSTPMKKSKIKNKFQPTDDL